MSETAHILLVDDEDMIIEFARMVLEEAGYRISAALDGHGALEMFSSRPDEFDLLVTDMAMPKMDGLELVRRCLAIRPGLPVILCSGYGDQLSRDQARESGVRIYLGKPVLGDDLRRAVSEALGA